MEANRSRINLAAAEALHLPPMSPRRTPAQSEISHSCLDLSNTGREVSKLTDPDRIRVAVVFTVLDGIVSDKLR